MSYNWFKIDSIFYGWFTMSLGSHLIEVSDFLGYDMPQKFLGKVFRVIRENTEEWLYLMSEPGAGILHIYFQDKQVCFEEYDLTVDSTELNNEDEEAEWNKRREKRWFHISEDIQNVIDGIVTEFSLYEKGNGRLLYEEHWGQFPIKEFNELKKYAYQLQENAGEYDGLFCTTFLGKNDDIFS